MKRAAVAWLTLFVFACTLKLVLSFNGVSYRYLGRIDPLDRNAADWALTVMDVGSPPGRGWDMAVPPLANRIAFWSVFLGVFGVEVATLGTALGWSVGRFIERRRIPRIAPRR